jgi:hypothetical protein
MGDKRVTSSLSRQQANNHNPDLSHQHANKYNLDLSRQQANIAWLRAARGNVLRTFDVGRRLDQVGDHSKEAILASQRNYHTHDATTLPAHMHVYVLPVSHNTYTR